MIWAGPLATAALVVVACSGELALEEVADGVELEPHAATIAATTAPIMTGSAFDLVEFVLKKRVPSEWRVHHGEKADARNSTEPQPLLAWKRYVSVPAISDDQVSRISLRAPV